jgi:hypothetical protein
MRYFLGFFLCGGAMLSLAACNTVTDNVVRANQSVQRGVYNSAARVQSWTQPHKQTLSTHAGAQTGFCYRGMGDIVCYDSPQPQMTNPMVGYQDATGAAAFAVAPAFSAAAPPQAMTTAPIAEVQRNDMLTRDAQEEVGSPVMLMPRY